MTTSHVIKTYCQENEPDQGGKEPVSNDPGPRAKQARVRLPEMQDSLCRHETVLFILDTPYIVLSEFLGVF